MSNVYLKGLNSLRFFAAFFVIISHGQISLSKLGFEKFNNLAIFNRGGDAVEFFYVLSGFLITYLLQKEIRQTGTVSIRNFYLRRVFRIWPLYFLIVIIGFVLLGVLYPKLTGQHFFEFPLWKGFLLFICFLPNLATSLYSTGMLFPLRTIGVEEQYYLFWAPLVKIFRNKIAYLIAVFIVFSYLWYYLLASEMLPFSATVLTFLMTQKFYAMATGGLFGLILYKYPEQYRQSLFAKRLLQWLVFIVIAYYYLVGYPGYLYPGEVITHFLMCGFYGLLILNSSLLDRPVVNLEKKTLVYLGTISYGLYMCHMLVDYVLRFTIMKIHGERIGFGLLMPVYHILLLGGAILLASISYKYFESYFLRLKERYA
ncbi:MAG TPA: acyltransferase [Puia sp.]